MYRSPSKSSPNIFDRGQRKCLVEAMLSSSLPVNYTLWQSVASCRGKTQCCDIARGNILLIYSMLRRLSGEGNTDSSHTSRDDGKWHCSILKKCLHGTKISIIFFTKLLYELIIIQDTGYWAFSPGLVTLLGSLPTVSSSPARPWLWAFELTQVRPCMRTVGDDVRHLLHTNLGG